MALTATEKVKYLIEIREVLDVSCPFTCLVSKLNHAEAVVMLWNITHKRLTLSDKCMCKDRGIRRIS